MDQSLAGAMRRFSQSGGETMKIPSLGEAFDFAPPWIAKEKNHESLDLANGI